MPTRSTKSSKQTPLPVIRRERPRLLRPLDDPHFRFEPPDDPVRRRILANLLADCELYAGQRPWSRIPRRPDSPHPYHQLYLTFYTAMQATALIENYAFAWQLTGDRALARPGSRLAAGGCRLGPRRPRGGALLHGQPLYAGFCLGP